MLKAECDAAACVARCRARVRARVASRRSGFRSRDVAGAACRRASLVIATGGLTVPKIGATPFGYRIAEQFGLAVVPPQPALVPLAAPPECARAFGDLSGRRSMRSPQ